MPTASIAVSPLLSRAGSVWLCGAPHSTAQHNITQQPDETDSQRARACWPACLFRLVSSRLVWHARTHTYEKEPPPTHRPARLCASHPSVSVSVGRCAVARHDMTGPTRCGAARCGAADRVRAPLGLIPSNALKGRFFAMSGRNIQGTVQYVAANRGNIPLLRLVLGIFLVGFFLLALMLQIQTSEAFLLNGPAVSLAPNWGILMQPIELVQGSLSINMAKAVMWGWGIELVYLICVIGEVSVHGRLQGWFKTGALVLVVFDFWTDFNYGSLGSGVWGQVAFAGITAFIVAFFGVIGLNLIWGALAQISSH